MLLLHSIVASVFTVGCVHTLYVPSKRLHKNRGADVSRGLQHLLNVRRNDQHEMMRELLRASLLRDQLIRGPLHHFTARREGQYDMMRELLRKSLLSDKNLAQPVTWLRQHATTPVPVITGPTPKDQMPDVVERQLQHALGSKTSALYDKPYIQKKGDREFLVLNPGDLDPFVSVIPNDIYYSIQKTCVNWLEDCTEQGMRAKLFRLVKSPYL